MRIRIIDMRPERWGNLFEPIASQNEWGREKSIMTFLPDDFREPEEEPADLVLSHVHDLESLNTGTRDTGYLEDCTNRNIMVVLYSGGTVSAPEPRGDMLTMETNQGVWQFRISNADYAVPIPYKVLSGYELPVKEAISACQGGFNSQEAIADFHNILLQYSPELEAKLNFLYACLAGKEGLDNFTKTKTSDWDLVRDLKIKQDDKEMTLDQFISSGCPQDKELRILRDSLLPD